MWLLGLTSKQGWYVNYNKKAKLWKFLIDYLFFYVYFLIRGKKMIVNKTEILNNREFINKDSFCVVYFLINKNKIVYVGKTTNGIHRIKEHTKDKKFDSFYYIRCTMEELLDVESENIYAYKPKYNKHISAGYRYDRKANRFYSKESEIARKLLENRNKNRKNYKITISGTDITFKNMAKFAEFLNVHASMITRSCKNGSNCRGYKLNKTDDGIIATPINR